jgi:hypothetical protein
MAFLDLNAGDEIGVCVVTRHGKHDCTVAKVAEINIYGHTILEDGQAFDNSGKARAKTGHSLIAPKELRDYLENVKAKQLRNALGQQLQMTLAACFKEKNFEPTDEQKKRLLELLDSIK